MKILLASHNKGKIKEFQTILEPLGYELITLSDVNQSMLDVEETGETFSENALIKAQTLFHRTGIMTIADDSGLTIDALPTILGVRSARFMGEDTDYKVKNETILELMTACTNRHAYFTSSIALVGEESTHIFEGICEGSIATTLVGEGGFGYDPIFIPDGFHESFGSMSLDVKNQISHRARALSKLVKYLRR